MGDENLKKDIATSKGHEEENGGEYHPPHEWKTGEGCLGTTQSCRRDMTGLELTTEKAFRVYEFRYNNGQCTEERLEGMIPTRSPGASPTG